MYVACGVWSNYYTANLCAVAMPDGAVLWTSTALVAMAGPVTPVPSVSALGTIYLPSVNASDGSGTYFLTAVDPATGTWCPCQL